MNWPKQSILIVTLILFAGCRSPWSGATARTKVDCVPAQKQDDAPAPSDPGIAAASHSVGSVHEPHAGTAARTALSGTAEHSIEAWLTRGHAAAERGDLEEAKGFYRQVVAEFPDHPVAHHRLAIIADRQNAFAAADVHYQVARRGKGQDADLLNDIGYSHLLRGDYAESERLLRQAIVLRPTHRDALNNLGHLFAKQGKYSAAASMLRLANPEAEAQAVLALHFPHGVHTTTIASSGSQLEVASLEPLCAPDLRPDGCPGEQTSAEVASRYESAAPDQAADPHASIPRVSLTEVISSEPAEHADVDGTVTSNLDGALRSRQRLPGAGASGAMIDFACALSEIHADQRPQHMANSLPAESVAARATAEFPRASDSIDPLESMPLWSPTSQAIANQVPQSGTGQFGAPQHPQAQQRPISISLPDTLPRTATGDDTRIYKEARKAGKY